MPSHAVCASASPLKWYALWVPQWASHVILMLFVPQFFSTLYPELKFWMKKSKRWNIYLQLCKNIPVYQIWAILVGLMRRCKAWLIALHCHVVVKPPSWKRHSVSFVKELLSVVCEHVSTARAGKKRPVMLEIYFRRAARRTWIFWVER